METQNNFPAPQQDSSSGANTVLLVIVILLLAGFGFWWYKHRGSTQAPAQNPSVINVTLPPSKTY